MPNGAIPKISPLAFWRVLREYGGMPARKSTADPHTVIARAVECATDTEPVRGEDLIGDPETRRKFLETKAAAKKSASTDRLHRKV